MVQLDSMIKSGFDFLKFVSDSMQIKVEKFSQKCLKNFNCSSLNKQTSHFGPATSHCITFDSLFHNCLWLKAVRPMVQGLSVVEHLTISDKTAPIPVRETWDGKNWCLSAFTNWLYFRQGTSFVTTFDTCVTYKFKHSHQRVAYFEYFKMAYFGYFIFLDLLKAAESKLMSQWHKFNSQKTMNRNDDKPISVF